MSKDKDIATLGSFDNALTLNAEIDMTAVAAVFVSRWEKDLFAKKQELSKRIKGTKSDLKILDTTVKRSVDKDQYNGPIPGGLGLVSKVDKVEVNWGDVDSDDYDEDDKVGIVIEIDITEKVSTARWGSESMDVRKHLKIPAADMKKYKEWTKELSGLNDDLLETMAEIKSIGRKTREITGVIAGKKLEASGYADLIDHPDLVKLITVDPID